MSSVSSSIGWQALQRSDSRPATDPARVEEYNVVAFFDSTAALAIGTLVRDFVKAPEGGAWRSGPSRAVVWAALTPAERSTLFMSDGAVEAARSAGLLLRPARRIGSPELPSERTLLLGEEDTAH